MNIKICKQCGKEYDSDLIDSSKFPKEFCCYSCYETWYRFNHESNCNCIICGKPMYMKQYRLNRLKDKTNITCSKECASKAKSINFTGSKNHQFGLKGPKNSSFSGDTIIHSGYVYEYRPDHPKADSAGRVRQHRLVVEDNWNLFDEKLFSEIDGKHILKEEYEVHHKNENKLDNRIENLQILTKSEHRRLHNSNKSITRDEKGRIVGVEKLGKFGENNNYNPET